MIVPAILQQHVDDAAWLASSRRKLTRAPYPRLERILQFDRRLLAHLDGLRLAGDAGVALREAALESPSSGVVFAVSVAALENRDASRLDRSIALAQGVSSVREGLLGAFGWVERSLLQGIVADLLADRDGFRRAVGIAACAMHRVDPGLAAGRLIRHDDPVVRARALRSAGELGATDLLTACGSAAREDSDPEAQFWSTWAGVLLGDRSVALDLLMTRGFVDGGAHRARAFRLALQAVGTSAAHSALQQLAGDPARARWLIEGSGVAGDPAYVPWLIRRMTDPATARIAGEAFALITGANLGASALDRPAPSNVDAGPSDDPDDPDVETDLDDGLTWPDVERIEAWWAANASRFQKGTRYFMGAPVTRAHCLGVLKDGLQRQRILAAHYLCLLDPGTPLFNTSAPAWRQQRLLASM